MQKLSKFLLFLIFFLSLFIINYSLLIGRVSAATPIPQGRLPCDLEADPNFNSLRPYQAAPCGDSDKALYCANAIIIYEGGNAGKEKTEGLYPADIPVPEKTYSITISDTELPFYGNTQLVKNASNGSDQIDDATKLNEYVSWYLSGVNGRAEYGNVTNDQIVNFSGPNKKLLPSVIQDAQRLLTIESASKTEGELEAIAKASASNGCTSVPSNQTTCTGTQNRACMQPLPGGGNVKRWCCDSQTSCDIAKNVPQQQIIASMATTQTSDNLDSGDPSRPANHNQVVVCESGGKAVPCPSGGELKLKDWGTGDLSIFNKIFNAALGWTGLTAWDKRYPPLPWQFDKDINYQKAYNEWRGKQCGIIFGKLLCLDVPGVTSNKWADLYQYIPLTNNSDKSAKMPIQGVQVEGKGGTEIDIQDPKYKILFEPVNMFAHTLEDKTNLDLLAKTYMPTNCSKDGICSPLEGKVDYNTVESGLENTTGKCRVTDVRSNEGDNLFTDFDKSEISVRVNPYHVIQKVCDTPITCEPKTKKNAQGNGGCTPGEIIAYACHWTVQIAINNYSKHPYANEVWNSSVANSNSIFRKMYPKVGEGSPVSCIADIPGVTKAVYTGSDDTPKDFVVQGPTQKYPHDDAQLFFPHIGAVYEYFLKGIQTALRPKGFGDTIPNGQYCTNLESGDCSWNMAKINQGIQNAASKYKVPASLLKAIFEIENADEINDPSKYQCTTPDSFGSIGVSQVREDLYKLIACPGEQMQDVGVCGSNPGKLSRCNFSDAFELMARALLFKTGRLSNCKPSGGISESEKMVWYNAACDYYGTHNPTDATDNYANEIPANEKRTDGMSYCDIVCWKMGQCSGSNYPPR